jgi:hypothetical protein
MRLLSLRLASNAFLEAGNKLHLFHYKLLSEFIPGFAFPLRLAP